MKLRLLIAWRHLTARKRQSLVSLAGIILGTAFFLAISSLMRGSERDFIRRLIDNSPHITVYDEQRAIAKQPIERRALPAALEVRGVQPPNERRGIRGHQQLLEWLRSIEGVHASPLLIGQGLIAYAGRETGVTINGMVAADMLQVTTIASYMIDGRVEDLMANPDGIIIGYELARKLSLRRGRLLTVRSATGQSRVFTIVGIFRTGRAGYDEQNAFTSLARAQSLFNRLQRVNSIIVKLPEPREARAVAAELEARGRYKAVSWQEASEDLMNTLAIRNTIMFSVVSAVLVVAAFGIYNVISTVVMEKQKDIAILKAMGFNGGDVRAIFLLQGVLLGIVGSLLGLPLGAILMAGLHTIRFRPPGANELASMPIDWGVDQFLIAAAFALSASIAAALLPAAKGAKLEPVHVLRGGA